MRVLVERLSIINQNEQQKKPQFDKTNHDFVHTTVHLLTALTIYPTYFVV
jgi:hypothetical protein